ncbi:hypothetical protein GCM10010483_33310 [Actinokineospora diospyrosa]
MLVPHAVTCGTWPPTSPEDGCDPADRATADRLVADPVLDRVPDGVQALEKFTRLPCQDDDWLGYAGRSFISKGQYDEIRAFHKKAFADRGWELRSEVPLEPVNGPDISDIHLCFERPDMPGITLGVYFYPLTPLDYSVRFRFGDRNQPCS